LYSNEYLKAKITLDFESAIPLLTKKYLNACRAIIWAFKKKNWILHLQIIIEILCLYQPTFYDSNVKVSTAECMLENGNIIFDIAEIPRNWTYRNSLFGLGRNDCIYFYNFFSTLSLQWIIWFGTLKKPEKKSIHFLFFFIFLLWQKFFNRLIGIENPFSFRYIYNLNWIIRVYFFVHQCLLVFFNLNKSKFSMLIKEQ
jgi:hypothetical protein